MKYVFVAFMTALLLLPLARPAAEVLAQAPEPDDDGPPPEYVRVEARGVLEASGGGKASAYRLKCRGRYFALDLPRKDRVLKFLAAALPGRTVVVTGMADEGLGRLAVSRIEPTTEPGESPGIPAPAPDVGRRRKPLPGDPDGDKDGKRPAINKKKAD